MRARGATARVGLVGEQQHHEDRRRDDRQHLDDVDDALEHQNERDAGGARREEPEAAREPDPDEHHEHEPADERQASVGETAHAHREHLHLNAP